MNNINSMVIPQIQAKQVEQSNPQSDNDFNDWLLNVDPVSDSSKGLIGGQIGGFDAQVNTLSNANIQAIQNHLNTIGLNGHDHKMNADNTHTQMLQLYSNAALLVAPSKNYSQGPEMSERDLLLIDTHESLSHAQFNSGVAKLSLLDAINYGAVDTTHSVNGQYIQSKHVLWGHISSGYMSYETSMPMIKSEHILLEHSSGKSGPLQHDAVSVNTERSSRLVKSRLQVSAMFTHSQTTHQKYHEREVAPLDAQRRKGNYASQHEKYAPQALFYIPVTKNEVKLSIRDFFNRENVINQFTSWAADFSSVGFVMPKEVQLNGQLIWKRAS
ncbi:hypothetical protein J8L98_14865 [Pseudoalteromonas sp. MMG013]|uniref:hypothetical protein n=1 Tax=Pseudoalteromonas sp. MMG013 TaxID=2822687 RepID=UPI001B35D4D2|nr:hypothetical protein [Pseudoalteromonas sp. MMG013]MBQ4862967.1 hypothetical protein [Pseudoalteromonas sp. MMG013]